MKEFNFIASKCNNVNVSLGTAYDLYFSHRKHKISHSTLLLYWHIISESTITAPQISFPPLLRSFEEASL
jgi:hypothetical protein